MITIADLEFDLDDKITRKKADTITLKFIGTHDIEEGEFELKAKFEGEVPTYWRALLGDGDRFARIYVTIKSRSKQTSLEETEP